MDQSTTDPTRWSTSRGRAGAGARGIDLCPDEHGFHRDLSGESTVVGEVSEGALSQRREKRPRGCGVAGGNGTAESDAFSRVGAWRRRDAEFAATDGAPEKVRR